MKFLLMLLLLASCGKPVKETSTVYNGKDGEGCTTEQFDAGVLIKCGATTSVVYNGLDGSDGVDGSDGADGAPGVDGEDGQDGVDGTNETGSTGIEIATITAASCTQILSTGLYSKYNGTNTTLYPDSSCDHNEKIVQINDGESYWLSDSLLGIKSKNTFHVINFGA